MKTKILSLVLLLSLLLSCSACKSRETTQKTAKKELRVELDLTREWNKVAAENSLVQGCIVAREDFLLAHPEAVANFLASYRDSVQFVNESPKEASELIVQAGLFNNAKVAEEAIPNCNIAYLDGEPMESAMKTYLEVLFSIDPAMIGGALPGEDFYYRTDAVAQDDTKIRVYSLNGTTGFGMAKLMSEQNPNYSFTVRQDASEVSAALLSKDADIAALPTNAAANLYNKTNGNIKILAINTLGCLYLLNSTEEAVSSLSDLKGKTVYVPAQNPAALFTYLCRENGLEVGKDIQINTTAYPTAAELRDAVASGIVGLAVLPEPMVSIARSAFEKGQ